MNFGINRISATRQGGHFGNSLHDFWIQHPLFSQEPLTKSAFKALGFKIVLISIPILEC